MLIRHCKTCKKEFSTYYNYFCSTKCVATWKTGKPCPWNGGQKVTKECETCKTKFSYFPSLNARFCSHKCYAKSLIGKPSWNKGNGDAPWYERIKNTADWKTWRESVFRRDNWTCVWCGKRGGRLVPDHIKPKSLYKELVFDVDNGRTLCNPCHKKTDTYGWKLYNFKEKLEAKGLL